MGTIAHLNVDAIEAYVEEVFLNGTGIGPRGEAQGLRFIQIWAIAMRCPVASGLNVRTGRV